ncbi:hypothetical protein WOLCODRAFT_160698 [Wolfiporia cocos MD-104 SS10]|uniref:Conidiation protein 6 n=1 Tax=Wolfiporia cocos (strain MD-104) TaxID=742152 RepID=A0A2H3J991_WOLCO|nr:hypothetical protein WOLCODRAFT_160698 [Wolfiporia cocos MD-104 SS10]
MSDQSEFHAQTVARGHKAAINNPNVSEEAKDNSRRTLEELEGSSNPEEFTASVGGDKASSYSSTQAKKKARPSEIAEVKNACDAAQGGAPSPDAGAGAHVA